MEMEEKIVKLIKDTLLTPVIYMAAEEDRIILFGFFDTTVTDEMLYQMQSAIQKKIKHETYLFDFRGLDAFERFEVVTKAALIYKESDFVRSIFESAMLNDYNIAIGDRDAAIQRMNKYGTPSFS